MRRCFFSAIPFFWLFLGCAGTRPAAFDNTRPILEIEKFFSGRIVSSGVFESRGGKPDMTITTETRGTVRGDTLFVAQDLALGNGKRQHRSWQLHRVDAGHVDAIANDMVHGAHGTGYGNMFRWNFRLALSPGNPLKNVRMSQFMYLQPDGKTLILRSIIRKAGIIVAEVTEQFVKD